MDSVLTEKARKYVLDKIDNYEGKLGHHFLRAMILAMEKQALQYCETHPKLKKHALLMGIYFHELGRLESEERDHTKHSVKLFDEYVAGKDLTPGMKEIVHDCCYNHLVDGIPVSKEGTFVKNWHWAISFEPESLLARLEDLQHEGNSFVEAKQKLFAKLEEDLRSIADDELRETARETLQHLREALKN